MNDQHEGGVLPLKNGRHERFAREMARHGDRGKAIEAAGFQVQNPRQRAYEILKRPEVEARIAHLQHELEKRFLDEATDLKDDVLKSLKETRALALERKELSAANKANELLGKTVGAFVNVERKEDAIADPIAEIRSLIEDPVVRRSLKQAIEEFEGRTSLSSLGTALVNQSSVSGMPPRDQGDISGPPLDRVGLLIP